MLFSRLLEVWTMAMKESILPISEVSSPYPEVVELNVGGQVYVTKRSTLLSVPDTRSEEHTSELQSR